ncbi:MAG: hypothetical protein J6A29_04910 [Clostridia bacterium]|nr:hypothetical protein [Clostridia bacterium]
MLAKYWKKIGLIILIVLCLINGISKLLKVVSFDNTVEAIKTKISILQKSEEKK